MLAFTRSLARSFTPSVTRSRRRLPFEHSPHGRSRTLRSLTTHIHPPPFSGLPGGCNKLFIEPRWRANQCTSMRVDSTGIGRCGAHLLRLHLALSLSLPPSLSIHPNKTTVIMISPSHPIPSHHPVPFHPISYRPDCECAGSCPCRLLFWEGHFIPHETELASVGKGYGEFAE